MYPKQGDGKEIGLVPRIFANYVPDLLSAGAVWPSPGNGGQAHLEMDEMHLATTTPSNSPKQSYMQAQPLLRAAFILRRPHKNIFFRYEYFKLLQDLAWYVRLCGKLCRVSMLQLRTKMNYWQMVLTAA